MHSRMSHHSVVRKSTRHASAFAPLIKAGHGLLSWCQECMQVTVGVRLIECVGHIRSALINMHACAHTYRTCLVLISWFGRVDHCRCKHCLISSRMGKKERKRSRDDSSTGM